MEYKGQRFIFDATRRLSHGGMGEVHEGARRDDPSIRVAIKTPFPEFAKDGGVVFLREAEAARNVASPHVVPVEDWGDQPPFIAFEFMTGQTLRAVIDDRRQHGKLWTEAELVALFRQLVTAMQAINARVIHRDLNPKNIFVDNGVLKVTDFGISKYVGDATRSQTYKGWGTLEYMAPESFTRDTVTERADQYSLGAVFFEMATFQQPFAGTPRDKLQEAHTYTTSPRLTELRPDLSERLATLVARMLGKLENERFSRWPDIETELGVIEMRNASTVGDDPVTKLSRKAAAQIDAARSEVLAQEQQENKRREKAGQRLQMLNWWASRIFGYMEQRVRGVNEDLGRQALLAKVDSSASDDSIRRCIITFPLGGPSLLVPFA